jgi:hypothetical protein
MLPPASSLAVCGPLSTQIEYIIIYIGNILDYCGNSVKNIEKLFNFDFISLFLKTFEMISNEREKGKTEFNHILNGVSKVLYNLSLEGSITPNSNIENSVFPTFQKINTIERLINLFIRLKPLNSPSEGLRNCLNYLSLSVCLLFRGQTPLVSSGTVLEYCDEMRKLPSPSEGYDFPKVAFISWDNLKNPDNVLGKFRDILR